MLTSSKLHKIMTAILAFVMAFSLIGSSAAQAQGGAGVKREVNAETGKVSFIGPESGRVLPASQALGTFLRPQDPGKALAKRFGPEFGLQNAERDLSEVKSRRGGDGRLMVRYQQQYQGIPVLGGELIVNTNDRGDLYSMNGEVSPDLSLSTQPGIDASQAAELVLAGMAKWYQTQGGDFEVSEPALWIFDESLLQPSSRPVELVWRMEATPRKLGMPVHELVLVNAQSGDISLHFNQVDYAWQGSGTGSDTTTTAMPNYSGTAVLGSPLVSTYTASSLSSLPGTFLCNQTQPNCTNGINPQADAAHKYAIGTYNLYATQHLRDSINDNGMPIISTVQYCNPDPDLPCPYGNAFWSGAQMVYGSKYGFALADDVVAHELTHGVTQYESNLFSLYQSGAIDESLSDLWGEYYDQTNGLGNDSPSVKWLIGEDVSGLRVVRSMKKPPLYGDPDRMKSPLYQKTSNDNGGIHHNSGVNNKAVYLMVDGGKFNKRTVTALGWEKVAPIYYEANTNLLSSASDYSDLYFALQQACTNLIGQHGIVAADCQEVKDALLAVQMNVPTTAGFNPDAPLCPIGTITDPSLTLFEDDLESGLGNWSLTGLAWTLSSGYASSGDNMLWANDENPYTDARATLASGVPIAAGKTFLHFKHAYRLDYFVSLGTSYYYDGGVLEYSTDSGGTWKDAKPLFSAGKNYGPAIVSNTFNPLAGRAAFVGDSHGYVSSRYNLSSLAGKTVKFRWRLGTDQAVAVKGWFVDDVRVYKCVPVPAIPTLLAPADNALITKYVDLALDWSDTLSGLDHYQLQVATDNTFAAPLFDVNTGTASTYLIATLTPNTKYFWRVRSFNSLGATLGWSKIFSFRAAILPPVLSAPDNLASLTTRRPSFDWDDVDGATGYNLVISKNANLSSPIRSVSVTTSDYVSKTDLPANTVLYWRVRATGPNGPSLWSAKRSFKTGNPPSVPLLLSPANNALVKDPYTPLLDWSESTLPPTTTFKRYELQVDDNNDFSSPVINVSTTAGDITDSSFTPISGLTPNTKYFWRVRAVNDVSGIEHFSGWSKVFAFRAAMLPPVLLQPANMSPVGTLKPVFDWDDVTGATGYTIQVSLDPAFGTGTFLVNTPVALSTFTPTTNLPQNQTIYWRVRANGPNGPSNWSSFQFTTP
jgi:bacillolysin